MPYSQFTFSKVKEQFDLTISEGIRFFPEHIAPSSKLLAILEDIGRSPLILKKPVLR